MSTRISVLLVTIGLVAAACGGGGEPAEPTVTTSTTSTIAASTTLDGETPPATTAVPSSGLSGSVDGVGLAIAESWVGTIVGRGTKPVVALGPDGEPGIALLIEAMTGFIGYADAGGGWDVETVAEGYYYGPIGLTYGLDGVPYIAYHDHQAPQFDQQLGDLTVASKRDGAWSSTAISNEGHDGWDSTIVAGDDGVLRAAGIDPQQFGRQPGVEYFELVGDDWEAAEIGSGPIAYEFNVSLAVQPDGEPALTYYDNNTQTLNYATRSNGEWSIEVVDDVGDPGRYSSLAYDGGGTPHISYVDLVGPTRATVRYATWDGSAWVTTDVATLDEVVTGFTGARRITQIQLDTAGVPHIVFGDEGGVFYGILDGDGWRIDQIAEKGDLSLGQLVSFALDDDNRPHIAFFEVTSPSPLDGTVVYLTRSE